MSKERIIDTNWQMYPNFIRSNTLGKSKQNRGFKELRDKKDSILAQMDLGMPFEEETV